jgi:hypothetical protein
MAQHDLGVGTVLEERTDSTSDGLLKIQTVMFPEALITIHQTA